MRRAVAFKHASELGDAPAHKLFDLVKVERKQNVAVPRAYADYEVTVGKAPERIEVLELV